MKTETYRISCGTAKTFKFLGAACGVFSLFAFVSAAFLALQPEDRGNGEFPAALLCGVFMGGLAFMFWHQLRSFSSLAITLSKEGIGFSSSPDGTWVTWDRIRTIRENPVMQRLELIDESGGILGRIEFQTERFQSICQILVDRYTDNLPSDPTSMSFSRPRHFHIGNIGIFTVLMLVWIFIAPLSRWWMDLLIAGGLAALFHEYCTSVTSISIAGRVIVVSRPLRRVFIPADDLLDSSLHFGQAGGKAAISVRLHVRGRDKPVVCTGMTPGAIQLQAALMRLRDRRRLASLEAHSGDE